MKIIGLTGGIGVGKTTAAKRFAAHGIPVIEADKVGHTIIAAGGAGEAAVLEAFGGGILTDGQIDRSKLGAMVFAAATALARLNAIVHPLIYREVRDQFTELRRNKHDLALLDAAILADDGKRPTLIDALVLITAPDDVRIARLTATRGLSAAQARERIAAQVPASVKKPLADYIIENSGTVAELHEQVDAVVEDLRGA